MIRPSLYFWEQVLGTPSGVLATGPVVCIWQLRRRPWIGSPVSDLVGEVISIVEPWPFVSVRARLGPSGAFIVATVERCRRSVAVRAAADLLRGATGCADCPRLDVWLVDEHCWPWRGDLLPMVRP